MENGECSETLNNENINIIFFFYNFIRADFFLNHAGFFRFPKENNDNINHAMGLWGIFMPGFMQFIAGTYIFLFLMIRRPPRSTPILYMAGLAFTSYGVHWFALGYNKYKGADTTVDGFMVTVHCIALLIPCR